ncbi:MAG: DNA topoisomerase IV subunit A [Candidatus Ancillula sp.]|jgi:DNA gyrase subunit A|nr:DNA topoisomerase IV subunit A [Candidatus Ancillula sp.]
MSEKKNFLPANERIVESEISTEMQTSFLEYAYSVIYARALPDARDGLKPVQRRIVYQMSQMNLYPDRSYVKSARVVGDVMGKLHPHGDSAIYGALVHLAQAFSLRIPLVDGHGNFGSPDDGPAASRYTEARMTPAAVAMCEGLDEDVVDFVPNYDNKLQQPDVLPSVIPNLLVNGGMGIAVGMATNMIPHNLGEVVKAAAYLVKNPEATLDELMKFVPGPDLPTGGKIIGLDAIRQAYETGRGTLRMRCRANIEKVSARKMGIVVTELPFLVGPEFVIEKIADLVKNGKIDGISKLNDLTDRKNGLKIVIEIKNGFNPAAILSRLYKISPLETNFGVNNVALVDGKPQTLGLKELLQVWVRHRLEVVRRQTEFRLKAKQDRLHLVEGLLIAILDIDEVIQVIRSSEDTPEASNRLQKIFDLSEIQANYILDLRLRRLTKFSKIELETEKAELEAEISRLQGILSDKVLLEDEVVKSMHEAARSFGDERRTELVAEDGEKGGTKKGAKTKEIEGFSSDLLANFVAGAAPKGKAGKAMKEQILGENGLEIPDVPCFVMMSATGLVARSVRGISEHQNRPPLSGDRENHDAIAVSIPMTTRGYFGVLTSHGRMLLMNAVDLPEIGRGAKQGGEVTTNTQGMPKLDKLEISGLTNGADLRSLVAGQLESAEVPVTIVPLIQPNSENKKESIEDIAPLAIGTFLGSVKRLKTEEIPHDRGGNLHDSWSVISLQPGDSVVGGAIAPDSSEICFISTDSSLLHFESSKVRPQGMSGAGMAGIKLADGQHVLSFDVLSRAEIEDTENEPLVFTVAGDALALPGTENGSGKLTPFNLYPGKGRATGGVRSQKFLKGQNALIFSWAGHGQARANTATGLPVEFPEIDQRRDGSGKLLEAPITAIG